MINDPKFLFAFNVNMMVGELANVIREQLNPRRVNWEGAHPDLLIHLQRLDQEIGFLNKISEEVMRAFK
jgi:hypothetical protein